MSGHNVRDLQRNNLLLSPSQRIVGGKTYQLIYRVSGARQRTIRAIGERIGKDKNWVRVGMPTATENSVGFVVKASSVGRDSFTVDGMTSNLKTVDPFGPGVATLVYVVPINLGTQTDKAPADNTAAAAQTREMTRTTLGETAGKITGIPGKIIGGLTGKARGFFNFFFTRGLMLIIVLIIGVFFVLPKIPPLLRELK